MLGDSIAAVIGFKSSPEAVAGGKAPLKTPGNGTTLAGPSPPGPFVPSNSSNCSWVESAHYDSRVRAPAFRATPAGPACLWRRQCWHQLNGHRASVPPLSAWCASHGLWAARGVAYAQVNTGAITEAVDRVACCRNCYENKECVAAAYHEQDVADQDPNTREGGACVHPP